jgi:hypothetical protein
MTSALEINWSSILTTVILTIVSFGLAGIVLLILAKYFRPQRGMTQALFILWIIIDVGLRFCKRFADFFDGEIVAVTIGLLAAQIVISLTTYISLFVTWKIMSYFVDDNSSETD